MGENFGSTFAGVKIRVVIFFHSLAPGWKERQKKREKGITPLLQTLFIFLAFWRWGGGTVVGSLPPFITPLPPSLPVTLQIFPSQEEGGGGH